MARAKNFPVYFITGDYDNVVAWTDKAGISQYVTILKCDATAIKTAARANPTLYLLKKGTILGKWSYADLDRALPALNELPVAQPDSLSAQSGTLPPSPVDSSTLSGQTGGAPAK
jgi:hypothetical protein